MNENIDLTKILVGCEGITLYSPICGKCIYNGKSSFISDYPIIVLAKSIQGEPQEFEFTKEGKYYNYIEGSECLLFPSKEQRDWSKFVKPIKAGTPMMCRLKSGDWALRYYAGIIDGEHRVFRNDNTIADGFQNGMIPFDKFNPNDIEESLKYNIQKHLI